MIPTLYENTGRSSKYVCPLIDCISCTVTEELAGDYTLELQYPLTTDAAEELTLDRVIRADANTDIGLQKFKIYKIEKSLNYITVYAEHVSMGLKDILIPDTIHGKNYDGELPTVPLADLLDGTGYTYYSNAPSTKSLYANVAIDGAFDDRITCYEALQEIYKAYNAAVGAWVRFDDYEVFLLKEATESDLILLYGRDFTEVNISSDYSDRYTHLMGVWKGTIDDVEVRVESAVCASPKYSTVMRKITRTMDLSDQFEDQPTADDLTAWVKTYLSNTDTVTVTPDTTITISGYDYSDAVSSIRSKYKELFHIGTIVRLFSSASLEIDGHFLITKTVYDCLQDRYTSAEIGSLTDTLADSIKSVSSSVTQDATAALQSKVSAMNKRMQEADEALEKEISDLSDTVDNLDDTVDDLDDTVSNLSTTVNNLSTTVSNLDKLEKSTPATGVTIWKRGHTVTMGFYGVTAANVKSVDLTYRPTTYVSVPLTIYNGSSCYPGWLVVPPDGDITTVKFFGSFGGAAQDVGGTYKCYGTVTFDVS